MLDDECISFKTSVEKFIKKHKRKLVKEYGDLPKTYNERVNDAMQLTEHAIYILKTLNSKRKSLSNAIEGFQAMCEEIVRIMRTHAQEQLPLKPFLRKLLMHFFIKYIHIRDGFVLLTSGECRHDGDANLAKTSQFQSRLHTLSKRLDGYTKMFSSNRGYSGWGWDEFHNEDVGVRRLILDSLRLCCIHPSKLAKDGTLDVFLNGENSSRSRENVWDKLLDSGAQVFESAFDTHENGMKDLQEKLERIRSKFLSNVESCLSYPGLTMVLEDKFERLELKGSFCIQRQGDAFCGIDDNGALPSGASKEYWTSTMELPAELRKLFVDKPKVTNSSSACQMKRRRVINDSDEDDTISYSKALKTSGVTVKHVRVSSKKTTSDSVLDIKRDYGVNSSTLEMSREEVEKEEKGTKVAAHVDEMSEVMKTDMTFPMEHEITQEVSDILSNIQDEMDNVQKYRSICSRKMKNDDELWDARECLRLSLVELGNACLEYHNKMKGSVDHACLSLAKSSFEEALTVISKLESLNSNENCEEKEKNFRKRAIILCRGRCLTNLGKTFFEQAESLINSNSVTGSKQHAHRLLRQAIKCFRAAEIDAQALRALAIVDMPLENRTIEQKIDADKLENLTNHLLAYTFLSLGRTDHCVSCIRKAAGISEEDSSTDLPKLFPEDSTGIAISKLHLMEDLYEASFSAISIASFLLQEKYYDTEPSKSNKVTDYLFSTLCEAYDQAAILSTTIRQSSKQELKEIVDTITSKEEMYTSKEILEFKSLEIDRYKMTNSNPKVTKNAFSFEKGKRNIPLRRSDIFRNSIALSQTEPSGRFIIDSSISSRKDVEEKTGSIKKKINNLSGVDGLDRFFSEDAEPIVALDECDHNSVTYLKWGNELFEEQGLVLNVYPNAVPPKPPDMI